MNEQDKKILKCFAKEEQEILEKIFTQSNEDFLRAAVCMARFKILLKSGNLKMWRGMIKKDGENLGDILKVVLTGKNV